MPVSMWARKESWHSTLNKNAWKSLEKLVYTINCVCVCNACSGQNYCYAWCFLFYLPTKLQKDELCHHLIWVVLWQLPWLLTCGVPTALTRSLSTLPSALCSASSSGKSTSPSSLLNKSYLKATSTDWSFGKQYYGYAKGTISLSPSSLL